MAAVLRPRPYERRLEIAETESVTPSGAAPARVIGAKMALEMRLPVARKPLSESLGRESKKHLVVPGDTITTDAGFMRYVGLWGHWAAGAAALLSFRIKPGPVFCI